MSGDIQAFFFAKYGYFRGRAEALTKGPPGSIIYSKTGTLEEWTMPTGLIKAAVVVLNLVSAAPVDGTSPLWKENNMLQYAVAKPIEKTLAKPEEPKVKTPTKLPQKKIKKKAKK
jgi:hypothetical protein